MDDTEEKGKPCPVCRQKLVLQYKQQDPRIRLDPVTGRARIPMRCTRCSINLEIAMEPRELLMDDKEDEK